MHEYSLIADLMRKIDSVACAQSAKRITCVRVKLGALAHISPEHLREHLVHACRGTLAESARLEVEVSTDVNEAHAMDIMLDSVTVEA